MFKEEKTYKVKITNAYLGEPKYDDDYATIVVEVEEIETGNNDVWIGSMSDNYGRGNFSSMTQTEITMKKLAELGLQNNDITRLESDLIGVDTTATTKKTVSKKDGKEYCNVSYLGGGGSKPAKLDSQKAAELAKKLFGAGAEISENNPLLS